MWELPDWWCDSDTRAALEQGLTAYDYALAHWQERAGGIAVEQVIAKLAATEMPELNA